MRPFQVPEMLRMPLTELCLQIKSLHLGDIKSFLLKAVEPPNEEAISSAVDLLYKVLFFLFINHVYIVVSESMHSNIGIPFCSSQLNTMLPLLYLGWSI